MAHKKGAGSSKNGRDSNASHLGIKIPHDSRVKIGKIIVRQRGLKIKPGLNVASGKDFTLYALSNGIVKYANLNKSTKYINII